MRTTVSIDDDVLAHNDVTDGTTFPAPAGAEPITSEDVYRSLGDWP